jgi:hypothetical protein
MIHHGDVRDVLANDRIEGPLFAGSHEGGQ